MTTLHIDFETYSAADLPACGLDNYASDPTTGVHCIAWCFDDEPVNLIGASSRWWPELPDAIQHHVRKGGIVVAHNASFELAIWNKVCVPRYGWPPLRAEQMRCTMAQAYAMSLPGSLEKAAAALGIAQQKDVAGARVMMQLARPKSFATKHPSQPGTVPVFWTPEEAPDKFQRLYDYCKQDVEVERALDHRMMQLSEQEQRVWVLDQIINQRGIRVDLPAIDHAISMVEGERARLDKEMLRVTGGVVGKCTEVQLLVKWIRAQGVEIEGLAKADVIDALKIEDMPSAVRKALLLRQEAAKSSTAKLTAMKNRASHDGRVRGCFQYHGASTGRWAHRGIQPGNLPRPRKLSKDDDENVRLVYHINDLIAAGSRDEIDMLYGPVMDALADGIRGMITAAPGHELVAMDFSAIEARVLAWLAGQESVLEIFRTHGKIYEHAASGIYRKPLDAVTKAERQIGKVAVLALGYGGGVGAFQSMARVYGVKVEDDLADEIKRAWREAHPRIVHYWHDLESAAINAVQFGCVCKSGPAYRQISWKKDGSFLWCRLPSGRVLCYPYPVVKDIETPWGEMKPALHFMSVNGVTNKWEETKTYGGSLSENVTQAVARDLLAEAMLRLEHNGYPVVMHVHDEAVVEIPASKSADATHDIERLMAVVPGWAKGLPVAAEGWRAVRYRK